jgi:uncharacterized protein (DUF952 family)
MTSADPVVYKICPRDEWLRARQFGAPVPSDDDMRDGYVHLSRAGQVAGTLARHFAGREDLVLLAVRVERLPEGTLRWEASRGGDLFPHLYDRLSVASVEQVFDLPLDESGVHALPQGLVPRHDESARGDGSPQSDGSPRSDGSARGGLSREER